MAATGNVSAGLWVITAAARIAVAAGDDEAVVDALAPLAAALRHVGLPDGTQPWRADLVVALVAEGRLDEAERELDELRGRAPGGGAPMRADVARAAGAVAAAQGDDEGAATAYAL